MSLVVVAPVVIHPSESSELYFIEKREPTNCETGNLWAVNPSSLRIPLKSRRKPRMYIFFTYGLLIQRKLLTPQKSISRHRTNMLNEARSLIRHDANYDPNHGLVVTARNSNSGSPPADFPQVAETAVQAVVNPQ